MVSHDPLDQSIAVHRALQRACLITLANDYAQSVGVESGLALMQYGPKNDIFEVYDGITEAGGLEAVAMLRGAIAHEVRVRKNKRAGGCLMIGDEA